MFSNYKIIIHAVKLNWFSVFFSNQASSFVIAYYLVMKHYGRALRRLLKEGEEKTMILEQFEKMIEVWLQKIILGICCHLVYYTDWLAGKQADRQAPRIDTM